MSDSRKSPILKMQVNMTCFEKSPATLLAMYNCDSRVLVLARFMSFTPFTKGVEITVGDDKAFNPVMVMGPADVDAAIGSYFKMQDSVATEDAKSRGRIEVLPHNPARPGTAITEMDMPSRVIEREGIDNDGWKYRAAKLTNKNAAILAACHYVETIQHQTNSRINFASSIAQLMAGFRVTI